jgi:Tol biopolymer transport system component
VTSTPGRRETWPFWSPHARRLVYQVGVEPADSDLVLWSEERGERPLPVTEHREEHWPAWAPDGPRLAYAFRGGWPRAGIHVLDLAGPSRVLLAQSGPLAIFFRPTWSADGRRLVAQRHDATGRGSQLWLLEPGRDPRPLTDAPEFFHIKPFFTRDDSRILFSRRRASGGPFDVWSIASDGSDPRPLLGDPRASEHSSRPSPSRDEFSFVSDVDGRARVYLAALDGSDVRALSPAGRSVFAPRWSPDGELLLVTLTEEVAPDFEETASLAATRVAVLDRSGRLLFETPGFMPDWMPAWP